MKIKLFLSSILLLVLCLFFCLAYIFRLSSNLNQLSSLITDGNGINKIEDLAANNDSDSVASKVVSKYNVDHDGNIWDYMSTLNILDQQGDNYEIYSDERNTAFHYYVMDNNGDVIDEGYHDWRGELSFEERDGILILNYGFGGSPALWQCRYYDVENGKVSRFFPKPVQTHEEIVVYYTYKAQSEEWVLVIQAMFNPAVYYREYRRDFSLFVYSMPSTAEFIDNGNSLQIKYWTNPNDDEIIETIDLH
ncbi:MAG: hypothetical protein FWH49_01455 [Clostridiales bacterium]|nr:hypothetical protein [Clostridiales bacterium]